MALIPNELLTAALLLLVLCQWRGCLGTTPYSRFAPLQLLHKLSNYNTVQAITAKKHLLGNTNSPKYCNTATVGK